MAGRNAQKADVILKDFWRQNERFADLFNAVIFRGKQIIKPEDLTERDTDMSGIIVSAKYCYATHELRLHQNDRCKRFTLV